MSRCCHLIPLCMTCSRRAHPLWLGIYHSKNRVGLLLLQHFQQHWHCIAGRPALVLHVPCKKSDSRQRQLTQRLGCDSQCR